MAAKKQFMIELVAWVQNTTLPADKIAKHFGVSSKVVQEIIDEVRNV